MSNYMRPDVYIERMNNSVESISSTSTSTAGMIGTSIRGKINEAVFVTSWTDYVNKFARGMSTPFMKNSDLSYAVYGFFQNGGSQLYVTRIAGSLAKKARATLGTDEIEFEAYDEGIWANDKLTVTIVAIEDTYNINVRYDDELVETIENVNINSDSDDFIEGKVNFESRYIRVLSAETLVEGEVTFTGGADGTDILSDSDYIEALSSFDLVDDMALLAIPGQTSKAVVQGILDYCSNKKTCFGVIDMPMGLDTTEAIAFKKEVSSQYGAIYYPWGKITDPIGRGKMRLSPPSGHIMGVYARTDQERGVHKAPAGLQANIRGIVETERKLSNADLEVLNDKNINTIVSKPNRGTVIWGARIITPHLDRKYVSDMRLDINIEDSLYQSTQWTLFEPNDEALWNKLEAQIKAYMQVRWSDGALFGESPQEAFFVKCDAELNPPETRALGRVIANVGYIKKNTTEFTIIRLSQKTAVK